MSQSLLSANPRSQKAGSALVDRRLLFVETDATFATLVGKAESALRDQPISAVMPELEKPLRTVLTTGIGLHQVPLARALGSVPTDGAVDLLPLRSERGTVLAIEIIYRPLVATPEHDGAAEPMQSETPAAGAITDYAALASLFDTAPIGLCILDPEYRYIRINQTLADLNCQPVAAHIGRTVHEVLPHLAPSIEPLFARVLASGEIIRDAEIVEERPPDEGGRRIWRASYFPVRQADGTFGGVGIVTNDITAYRQATEALRLSEERFRVALQNSPVLVYTTDRELRYTWIYNPHPAYDPTQVIGKRDEDLLPISEAAKLTEIKQTALDGEHSIRSEVALLVDGREYVYDLTVEPLRDADGAVVGLTVAGYDISDRRHAEAALRESEARYSAVAEAVPAILFSNRPDGTSDYISQNFYDFTGMPRGSGEGYGWVLALHPADRERVTRAWQTAVETGMIYDIEYRFRRSDGVYHWFRARSVPFRASSGAVVSWFGVCLDINDSKQVATEREQLLIRERDVRQAAERAAGRISQLQAVTAALSEAASIDQVSAVVVEHAVNTLGATAASLFLVDAAHNRLNMVGNTDVVTDIIEDWQHIALDTVSPVADVVHSGEPLLFPSRDDATARYPQTGKYIRMADHQAGAVIPLKIEGQCIGAMALAFAEKREFSAEDRSFMLALASQAAQALERARLYAEAQAAVQARDSFIAVAAHDLRSPLTVVHGQVQLLERKARREGLSDDIIRRIELIGGQSARLNRMITALLDLSRIQSGKLTIEPAPLDLTVLLQRITDEVRLTIARHTLKLSVPTTPLRVMGDELRLDQVFYNLIGNAIKYSPHGGTVTITIEQRDAMVCVNVSDEGIGIPPEALPRLFERFYRADNADQHAIRGMGIGLYAVQQIVALHGGEITVTSSLGNGSTFCVSLPAYAADATLDRIR